MDRKHLKKSFEAGEKFHNELKKLKDTIGLEEYALDDEGSENKGKDKRDIKGDVDIGIKFVVWDWIAGMTDSYVLKEYESFTFKKLDFK
jgi:dGTP triphosphohydrolase